MTSLFLIVLLATAVYLAMGRIERMRPPKQATDQRQSTPVRPSPITCGRRARCVRAAGQLSSESFGGLR